MRTPMILISLLLLICGGALFSATIGSVEYFFDSDPGQGMGSPLSITPGQQVSIDQLISASHLSPGFHSFHARAKDNDGAWGLPSRSTFYIPFPTEPVQPPYGTISQSEYFFDSDPGQGMGTPLSITPGQQVSIDQLISASHLSSGFHSFHARAKDNDGAWGLPSRRTFYVPLSTEYNPTPYADIVNIEYFFNSDPGQGNAIQIWTRNPISIDELIATSMLSPGFHSIHVRAKDSDGEWGMPSRRTFFIPPPWVPTPPNPLVAQLEYYVDDDPGFGQGVLIPVTPGSPVSVDLGLSFPGLEHGNHQLWVRAMNTDGLWSLPVSRTFSDGVPSNLNIAYADEHITITWDGVYSVDTYKVYSNDDINSLAEDSSGVFDGNSWTAPVVTPKKFYHVTSIYDEQ
ncbi:MAG: hypothetical protein GXY81_03475 [Candidatus Cloacimonetes bacterium]|nr:hypothetical protein [Candidatus Cloacimonadota bacterium]